MVAFASVLTLVENSVRLAILQTNRHGNTLENANCFANDCFFSFFLTSMWANVSFPFSCVVHEVPQTAVDLTMQFVFHNFLFYYFLTTVIKLNKRRIKTKYKEDEMHDLIQFRV